MRVLRAAIRLLQPSAPPPFFPRLEEILHDQCRRAVGEFVGEQLFGGRSFAAKGLAQAARRTRVALEHAVIEFDSQRCNHDRDWPMEN